MSGSYISYFNEDFIKSYNEESDFIKVDVQYFKKLHELHNDLLFLPDRTKIEKIEKLVTNFHDKTELARLLPIGKNKKVTGLMKDELVGK